MSVSEALMVLEDAYRAEQMANVGALRASIAEELGALEVTRDGYGIVATFGLKDVRWRMRWVWPGKFLMGSPKDERGRMALEWPQHEVVLTRGFWLGETPVTWALWFAALDAMREWEPMEAPISNVRRGEAANCCLELGMQFPGLDPRLPTEAEWECACRAGTTTATWLGDYTSRHSHNALMMDPAAWFLGNARGRQDHPVGRKEANPWGFHDMLGNVGEWCADRAGISSTATKLGHGEVRVDPQTVGSHCVSKGSSWRHAPPSELRAAARGVHPPAYSFSDIGFRLAGWGV